MTGWDVMMLHSIPFYCNSPTQYTHCLRPQSNCESPQHDHSIGPSANRLLWQSARQRKKKFNHTIFPMTPLLEALCVTMFCTHKPSYRSKVVIIQMKGLFVNLLLEDKVMRQSKFSIHVLQVAIILR